VQPLVSCRGLAAFCAVAVLSSLSLPSLAGAGSAEASPEARTSAKCDKVTTRNGGIAEFINTVKARCRVGRRVARRANGTRYQFLGFDCKLQKNDGLPGKLYGCGRAKNGQGQGVGFIYRAP